MTALQTAASMINDHKVESPKSLIQSKQTQSEHRNHCETRIYSGTLVLDGSSLHVPNIIKIISIVNLESAVS